MSDNKRKNRLSHHRGSIPAFLLKTYEILEVFLFKFKIKIFYLKIIESSI